MSGVVKILFICHGNICRSATAEFVLKDLIEKKGLCEMFHIESRATSTEEIWNGIGNPIYPPAREELKRRGLGKTPYTDFSLKRAQQLKRSEYDEYDFLIGMDSMNMRNIERMTGHRHGDGKIWKLLEFCGLDRDVSDPWYSGRFSEVFDECVMGCEGLLNYLKDQKIL
ncbi:MAG: low molecular weight phosphotyrosine protein phosphatase [Clostridiales bacterium]|nr:low molecular weight phosphotyrosine protein phosphatase [Clostridiales bacterium]